MSVGAPPIGLHRLSPFTSSKFDPNVVVDFILATLRTHFVRCRIQRMPAPDGFPALETDAPTSPAPAWANVTIVGTGAMIRKIALNQCTSCIAIIVAPKVISDEIVRNPSIPPPSMGFEQGSFQRAVPLKCSFKWPVPGDGDFGSMIHGFEPTIHYKELAGGMIVGIPQIEM